MELGEPDASGRRRPVEIAGSEYELDVDCVIMALGTSPNPLIKSTTKGLEINKKGGIVVNEDGLTSREGVYAGGDAVTGAATVILAMTGSTKDLIYIVGDKSAAHTVDSDSDYYTFNAVINGKADTVKVDATADANADILDALLGDATADPVVAPVNVMLSGMLP